jgi:hypothetical protein
MAKSIKCPTCGSAIEITPQAVGQVVKCPGCGRGIKLVAKQKPGTPSGAAGGARVGGPNDSMSSTRMNESQRSYVGEPAITDEPPRLDATCESCGKITDQADLVEDEGRLICKECAVASAAQRSEGAAIDFAPPTYVPSRRGNLINFTPITFVFLFFALMWLGAYLMPRFGVGTRPDFEGQANQRKQASLIKRPSPRTDVASTQPATQEAAAPSAEETAAAEAKAKEEAAAAKAKADEEWEKANRDEVVMRFDKANRALAEGNKQEADRLYQEAFDFIKDREFKDQTLASTVLTAGKLWKSTQAAPPDQPQPGPTPPVADASAPQDPSAVPPANATDTNIKPTTPLGEGLLKLRQKDYVGAAQTFEALRKKMIPLPQNLTNEQQLILIGKAAADLGRGQPDLGRDAIDVVYQRGNRTRPVVLNRAMIYLASNYGTIKQLADLAVSVRGVMSGDDELAANIYGTILHKLASMPLNEAYRAEVSQKQKELDELNDQQSAQHEGKLKWGIDWLPAEDVKRYRLLKGSVQDAALTNLYRELERAKVNLARAQKTYDAASQTGGNVTSQQKALDAAKAQTEASQQKVNDAKQAVQPQRWLEKFEPIIPEELG